MIQPTDSYALFIMGAENDVMKWSIEWNYMEWANTSDILI